MLNALTIDAAKGAAFHLLASDAPLRAAEACEQPLAATFGKAAESHLIAAREDLTTTLGSLAADTSQATSGARELLIRAQGELRSALQTGVPHRDQIRAAARDAHAGALMLSDAAGDAVPLLPHSIGVHVGAEERALVRDWQTARAYRRASDVTLDALEQRLHDGRIDEATRQSLAPAGNFNGAIDRVDVVAERGASRQRAVLKGPDAQAAQEEIGWRMMRTLDIAHLAPATVRRNDGVARIEFVDGEPFWSAHVQNSGDIDRLLTDDYQRLFPSLSRDEAGRAARTDRELLQVADYLLANNDRHVGNGIVSGTSVHVIDHGFAFRGERADPVVPELKHHFQGPDGQTALHGETLAIVRTNVTDDALRAAHAVLRRAPGDMHDADAARRLLIDQRDDQLRRMTLRRDHLMVEHGFSYRPIGDADHPLDAALR